MHFSNDAWPLSKVIALKARIDPRPQWQRGEAWRIEKKQLLLDSILIGLDIPKIYLWKLDNNAMYDFAVADGQQRLLSIWGFVKDEFALNLTHNASWAGKKFNEISIELQNKINDFEIVITIVEANEEEIRELFARLQKGVQLTSPQIRNSLASALGTIIRQLALTHKFFPESPFSAEGFVRDDFLAHVFALELQGSKGDIKAPNLAKMYQDYRQADEVEKVVITKVNNVLDQLHRIQKQLPKGINTKWGCVDLYWYLSKISATNTPFDAEKIAKNYHQFETKRKKYVGDPSKLLDPESEDADRDLYNYIEAFRVGAGLAKSIDIRSRSLIHALSKDIK